MPELTHHLNRIREKLQALVKQHQELKLENRKLKEELAALRDKDAGHQETLEALRQQVGILKMNTGDLGEKDKKELEKKLNHYIREIDRCINMLST